MLSTYLWIIGSLPFIILGSMHLVYTFFTSNFSSRNEQVNEGMKTSSPVLTRSITMWKAWTGFNASHSSGAIYIGIINLAVAIQYPAILHNIFYLVLNNSTVLFYLWLAKQYWFRIPLIGILITCICFITATILILL